MASEWTAFRLGNLCTKLEAATPRGGNGVYLDRGEATLNQERNLLQ